MKRKYTQTAIRTVELTREIIVDIPDGIEIDQDILNDCLHDGLLFSEWEMSDDHFEPDHITFEIASQSEEVDLYYSEYTTDHIHGINNLSRQQSEY